MEPHHQLAFDAFVYDGKNIFITGAGGVGKTTFIREIYHALSDRKKINLSSTTGISAIAIGGTTIHSLLGLGLGRLSTMSLYNSIIKNAIKSRLWCEMDILVIDEISMMQPELFDKIEEIARMIRRSEKPFGGVQLLISGDFCQLPCVGNPNFCFEAFAWSQCIDRTFYFRKIFRQVDPTFQNILDEIRMGIVTPETKKFLSSRIDAKLFEGLDITPTLLFSKNDRVDSYNAQKLEELAVETDPVFYDYECRKIPVKTTAPDVIRRVSLLAQSISNPISLCVGAQVMLICNFDLERKLANGSRGVVVDFSTTNFPIVKFTNGYTATIGSHTWEFEDNGRKVLAVKHIPLKLAYATSIHKSQGLTLDCLVVDLNNIFEFGQAYCALSRASSIEGLSIVGGIQFSKIMASPKAVEYYRRLEENSD